MNIINKISILFGNKLTQFVIDFIMIVSITWLIFSVMDLKKKNAQNIKALTEMTKIIEVYPVFASESGEVLLIDKKSYVVKNVLSKDVVNGIFNLKVTQITKDYNKSVNK